MSKKTKNIPFNYVERIAVLFGEGKSLAEVKAQSGADLVMNGGYYTRATNTPVCHLKVDGKVYAEPPRDAYWNDWGYTWNTNDIRLAVIPDDSTGANHITATRLLAGSVGPTSKLTYGADQAGERQRTAMALTGDSLILYCSDTPITPEELRDDLVAMGAVSAIMLDGGGSSQCDFGNGNIIESDRRVNNYIAVWLTEEGRKKIMSKKVVLDPGHGVETAGKRSPDGTYYEHEFALDMAKRIKHILPGYGVEVVLTRTNEKDVSLQERVKISNAAAPDLFVSLHSNAAGSGVAWMTARGYGIYTSAAGDDAGRNIAARAILARAKEAGLTLWGGGLHHDWADERKDIYVLWHTAAPAVLIEHLFHDNLDDVALLKDDAFRSKLAEIDCKGILDYLGIPWEDKPTEEGNVICCPHCGGRLKIEKG